MAATIGLSDEERALADELCRLLAAKHAFGRRATLELRVEDLRVVEAFAHIRIARGGGDANAEPASATTGG